MRPPIEAWERRGFLTAAIEPREQLLALIAYIHDFEAATGMQIGALHISEHPAGGIWIEKDGGEGMQCRTEDLENMLNALWDEKF